MGNYITVDGGTTNTRITVICDGKIIDSAKFNVGIRNAINNKEVLFNTIKVGIQNLLEKNSLCEDEINCIIGCGMITSEFGLCHLEHINAPCGISELSNGLFKTVIDDISPLPFAFIRGVKINADFESADMMRGEETELFGITDEIEKDGLYVLPGSHSKLIYTDDEERISHFSTELTGELISAVANSTILKDIIDLSQNETDSEFLQKGYLYTKQHGINAALFKTRTLQLFFECDKKQLFSFFLGSVLTAEIENIIKSNALKVIIGGKHQLKAPMATLLKINSDKNIVTVSDIASEYATAYGCVRIYENNR